MFVTSVDFATACIPLLAECTKEADEEEYNKRLNPESFVQLVLNSTDKDTGFSYQEYEKWEYNGNKFILRDKFGLKVVEGAIQNGSLEGNVRSYFDGILIMEGVYEDGEKNGRFKMYNNNKLVFDGEYRDGIKCGVVLEYNAETKTTREVEYDQFGNHISEIEKNNGNKKRVIMCNNNITEEGGFSIRHMGGITAIVPEGRYAVHSYKSESTPIIQYEYHSVKETENDVESTSRVLRQIEGNDMTIFGYNPFDPNNVILYIGSYVNSFEKGYPRNNRGIEVFNCVDGSGFIARLYSNFDNDRFGRICRYVKEETGLTVCNELWDHGELKKLTMFDDNGNMVYHGDTAGWVRKQTITSFAQLRMLSPLSVTELVIGDDIIFESGTKLFLDEFLLMREFRVGKRSCENVISLKLFHLPHLERVEIGDDSFSLTKTTCDGRHGVVTQLPGEIGYTDSMFLSEEDTEYAGKLVICYNDTLTHIVIGDNCFTDYIQCYIAGII